MFHNGSQQLKELALNIAGNDFFGLFESTVNKSEITKINSNFGSAILMDKSTWDSMNETLMLLQDKTALRALLLGHQARDNGTKLGKLIEDVN